MSLTRFLAAGVCAAAIVTGADAQTLNQNPQPAEFPPASYAGTQYVDSRGCVFIRAGVNGLVTWVPRVSRDRRLICGAQPTQVAGTTAAAPARTASAAAPVQIVPTQQAQAPVTTQQATAPRATATRPADPVRTTRAPMPTVATTLARPAAPSPAPATVAVTRPSSAPAPVVTGVVQQRGGKCPNASDFSNRWVNDGSYGPVRCGPQQLAQGTALGSGGSVAAGGDRILPAHVHANRFNTQNVAVPEGYAPVWEDDRLNPRRAEQTAQGHRQTQEVWTNTVPRRLASPARTPRVTEARIVTPQQAGVLRAEAPVIATRSAPQQATAPSAAAKAQPPATGDIYVQVAMFGVVSNAQATAQRLAGSGLPVRTGTLTRGGTSYQLVLAGPFANRGDAQAALGVARRLGFADAYIR